MGDKTYIVVADEYYLSMVMLKTLEQIHLITVSYDEAPAREVQEMYQQALEGQLNVLNAKNEMLVSFDVGVHELEGHLSIEEARAYVDEHKDFTWGKVGKGM